MIQVIKGNKMIIDKQTKKMNDIEMEKNELQKKLNDSLNMTDTTSSTINSLIKEMEKDKSLSSIVPLFHHLTNINLKLKSENERLSHNSMSLKKYTQFVQDNLLQHRNIVYDNKKAFQKEDQEPKRRISVISVSSNESKNDKQLIEKLKKENSQLLASQESKNKEIKMLREQLCKLDSDDDDNSSNKIDMHEYAKLKSELKSKDDILNSVINTTDMGISSSYNQKLQAMKYNKQMENLNKKLKELTDEKEMLLKEKKKLETIILEKERKNEQSQYHFQLIMEENERLKSEVFNNQFYEELEDLKENYKEALAQNKYYIQVIEKLKNQNQNNNQISSNIKESKSSSSSKGKSSTKK